MGQVAIGLPAHRNLARRPDRARPAVPAAAALDHCARSILRKGYRTVVRRGVRWRHQPRRLMALHLALSGPRSHGGEGQRLLLWPQARNHRRDFGLGRRSRPAAGADRQFRRGQVLAGAGRRACFAQASGLARGGAPPECVASGFSGQPPMVLPFAQARHRSAEIAGRVLPRHLAIRRHRCGAGEAAA